MEAEAGKITPFALRLPPELKAWVLEQAKKDHRSANSWLTLLIERAREELHARMA